MEKRTDWNEQSTEKLTDIILDETKAIVNYWWKDFEIKKLKLKGLFKIIDILGKVSEWVKNKYAEALKEWKWELNDFMVILQSLNENDLYELIAIILNTNRKEAEELFNLKDFTKLIDIFLRFEDISSLFTQVQNILKTANPLKMTVNN